MAVRVTTRRSGTATGAQLRHLLPRCRQRIHADVAEMRRFAALRWLRHVQPAATVPARVRMISRLLHQPPGLPTGDQWEACQYAKSVSGPRDVDSLPDETLTDALGGAGAGSTESLPNPNPEGPHHSDARRRCTTQRNHPRRPASTSSAACTPPRACFPTYAATPSGRTGVGGLWLRSQPRRHGVITAAGSAPRDTSAVVSQRPRSPTGDSQQRRWMIP